MPRLSCSKRPILPADSIASSSLRSAFIASDLRRRSTLRRSSAVAFKCIQRVKIKRSILACQYVEKFLRHFSEKTSGQLGEMRLTSVFQWSRVHMDSGTIIEVDDANTVQRSRARNWRLVNSRRGLRAEGYTVVGGTRIGLKLLSLNSRNRFCDGPDAGIGLRLYT